jgi:hypothetical protein
VFGGFFSGPNDTFTDSAGYFIKGVLACNYSVSVYYPLTPTPVYQEGQFIIAEPDSTVCLDFYLENILVGLREQQNFSAIFNVFPSPSTGQVQFCVKHTMRNSVQTCLIKVYDQNGEIVSILPLEGASSGGETTISWDCSRSGHPLPAGAYFCVLELHQLRLAVEKLILIR